MCYLMNSACLKSFLQRFLIMVKFLLNFMYVVFCDFSFSLCDTDEVCSKCYTVSAH